VPDSSYHPFFDRIASRLPRYGVGKLLSAAIPGVAFLALHLWYVGERALHDWSWLLGLIISASLLSLFYATHTFRAALREIRLRTSEADFAVFVERANRVIGDRRLVLSGTLFGLTNCLFGLAFGLPDYGSSAGHVSLLVGYFLAGLFCGMAAYGICGVSLVMNELSGSIGQSLDFTDPDRCGGTGFVGAMLVVFSAVTLIVGVMISVYILKAPWSAGDSWWVLLLKGFWIAFPYLMSLTALVVPAMGVHEVLVDYKTRHEARLRGGFMKGEVADGAATLTTDSANPEVLDQWREMRAELHRMRTWPYDLNAHLKYLFVLIPNVLVSFETASAWLSKLAGMAT